MINAADISFGDKVDSYIPTKIGGNLISLQLGTKDEPLRVPFGVSEPLNGGKAERKTMDIEVDGDLAGMLKAIDAHVVSEAIKRPLDFFGKNLDEAAVRAMHIPLVTEKEGKLSTVRTKVKLGAKLPTVVRVVTGESKFRRGSADDVTKNSKVAAMVGLSSVWFATKMFGVSLNVDQLMVWPGKDTKSTDIGAFTGFDDFVEEE